MLTVIKVYFSFKRFFGAKIVIQEFQNCKLDTDLQLCYLFITNFFTDILVLFL